MLGGEGGLLHPSKHTLSRIKQPSTTFIVGSLITSRLHKSNSESTIEHFQILHSSACIEQNNPVLDVDLAALE